MWNCLVVNRGLSCSGGDGEEVPLLYMFISPYSHWRRELWLLLSSFGIVFALMSWLQVRIQTRNLSCKPCCHDRFQLRHVSRSRLRAVHLPSSAKPAWQHAPWHAESARVCLTLVCLTPGCV